MLFLGWKKLFNKILLLNFFYLNFLLKYCLFLKYYYLRNENLWLDGFLFDFLQKKTTDLWVRQYIILTGFLFSEKLVFDFIINLYSSFLIKKPTPYIIFETSNVGSTLNIILFSFCLLLVIITIFNILF